ESQPDLVILCGYSPLLHTLLALWLRLCKIKIGLRSDNTLRHSDFSCIKGALKRLLLPPLLRMYDTWHPVGTLAREYLEAIAGTTKPTYLFPYNVDNDWFVRESAREHEQANGLRKVMGLANDDFVILGVLKWHPREDPLT